MAGLIYPLPPNSVGIGLAYLLKSGGSGKSPSTPSNPPKRLHRHCISTKPSIVVCPVGPINDSTIGEGIFLRKNGNASERHNFYGIAKVNISYLFFVIVLLFYFLFVYLKFSAQISPVAPNCSTRFLAPLCIKSKTNSPK